MRARWLWHGSVVLAVAALAAGCTRSVRNASAVATGAPAPARAVGQVSAPGVEGPDQLRPFQRRVLADLERQTRAGARYQDGYFVGGDPPAGIGVCTDVVVRSYGAAGVDLRAQMAADVARHRAAYDIDRPDPNIDHRRCRKLIVFFRRRAMALPCDGRTAGWQPADVVFWSTRGDGTADHVGVVGPGRGASGVPMPIHHWPGQTVAEADVLRAWQVVGHFRWPDASRGEAVGRSGS